MSQPSDVVKRLVDSVVTKLTEEVNSWRENTRLRIEGELYEAARSVIEKYASAIDEIEKEVKLEREFRLYNTMIELERQRLQYVESFLDKVLQAVQEKVKQLKDTPKYREYLKACLNTAKYYLGTDEFIVKCSESDKKVIEELAAELKLNVTVETTGEELYGIKAMSRDGRVSIDLTLPTRLSLIREKVKGILAKYAKG